MLSTRISHKAAITALSVLSIAGLTSCGKGQPATHEELQGIWKTVEVSEDNVADNYKNSMWLIGESRMVMNYGISQYGGTSYSAYTYSYTDGNFDIKQVGSDSILEADKLENGNITVSYHGDWVTLARVPTEEVEVELETRAGTTFTSNATEEEKQEIISDVEKLIDQVAGSSFKE